MSSKDAPRMSSANFDVIHRLCQLRDLIVIVPQLLGIVIL